MSRVSEVLGPKFTGTLIEDPILEPFFIVKDPVGGFILRKTRISAKGELRFTDVCYPSNFSTCLEHIAQEKLNEPGKVYETVTDYISEWKRICKEFKDLHNVWKIKA